MFPSGHSGTYIRVNYSSDQSVAILPVTNEGKIVVIKNFRHGVRGWGYEVPKGSVENNENIREAALRELKEETGYTSDELIELDDYSDSPAIISSKIRCYIALGSYKISEKNCERTEAIQEALEIFPEDLLSTWGKLNFRDALTELLVYKYQIDFKSKYMDLP